MQSYIFFLPMILQFENNKGVVMKIFLQILFSISVSAQITITNSDFSNMFIVGSEITVRENTGGGIIDIGAPGGNNAWDFSQFQGNLEMNIAVINPATSPHINEFPDANVATYSLGDFEGDEGEIWSYSNLNGVFGNLGSAVTLTAQPGDLFTIKYNPPRIESEIPLTFNSSWSETYAQTIYVNGTTVLTSSVSISVIVDAYGIMTLPGGAIFDALRIRETMTVDGMVTTVSYSFLTKSGAQVTLNAADENPPTSGEIAVETYTWNFEFTPINLILAVTHPGSNDIVIAGESDSIKYINWSGDVDLYYSLDDGENFELIDSSYSSAIGTYYWNVPDSLLTTAARIKVVDSTPDSAQSGSFKIKPWQLSRLNVNEDFELYEPDQHGWNFCNCRGNVWPQNWWEQFDYQSGTDPFTNVQYPPIPPFLPAPGSAFPDWPLFVDAFTESACYRTIPFIGLTYRPNPMFFWGGRARAWGGSCFGFAASSLLGFYHKENLVQLIGEFGNLNSVPISEDTRRVVNSFQIYQWDKEYRNERRDNLNDITPRDLLSELKEMLSQENGDGRVLAYWNNDRSGGHAVVPYKLERADNQSRFNLIVYNPNRPDSTNEFIYIDSVANTWSDSTSVNFGTGSNNCILERISESFIYPPNFKPAGSDYSADYSKGELRLNVYNTHDAEIMITSSTGEQIGYQDSVAFNNMNDAVPDIPLTGYFHPPIGYDLPFNNYSINLNNFTSSFSFVHFETDSTLYGYRRFDAGNNQTDLLTFSENGIGITNPDQAGKNVEFETIILEDTTSEKVFLTNNVLLSAGDSIKFKEIEHNDLLINNFGEGMSYDLQIRIVSVNNFNIFEHSAIPMDQNSGHQLVPNWNDLQNAELKILIDFGNDGTIDDSIFVKNQTTNVEDEGSLLSPDSYNLAQNYPNPFNPITTIKYSIPESGNVSLKVYDMLGKQVASLVNEEKSRGVYSVIFDASNLSSGVYFYKLQSGSFTETKKMLLLK
jgi:hypothetical protein